MKVHDVVFLTKDLSNVKKGTKGTIVFDYERAGMVEVEFVVNGIPIVKTTFIDDLKY